MAPALSGGGDSTVLRREALARVPGCEKGLAPIAVTPMQGGTSNAVFRVQTRLGYFVMRLNEPEAAQLGVDRARESVLHQAAAAAGLAPAVVHADAAGRFLITEYLTAPVWTEDALGDPQCLDTLAEVLRQLHTLVPPAVADEDAQSPPRMQSVSASAAALHSPHTRGARESRDLQATTVRAQATPTSATVPPSTHTAHVVTPFRLEALLRHHLSRAVEANPVEAGQLQRLVERAESSLAASRAQSCRAPAIIHNDLHHSNLIGWGHRLRLVDWEYAAVADPLYDIACLLAYYPQAEPYAERLLEHTGLSIRASVDELSEIAWVYVLLSYLWYRTRASLAPASSQDREAEHGLRARLGS